MWLAIDVGNTNIHIGTFENGALRATYTVKIESPQTLQENIEKAANPHVFRGADAIVVASVNPPVEKSFTEYIKRDAKIPPLRIGKDIPISIPVLTDNPEKVGTDRLVNAIAAFERTKNWTVVVDAGTAITIDGIDNNGAFLGGVIAPGMGIASKALHRYTALLPDIQPQKPENVLGKNTAQALHAGIYWGTVGMIRYLVDMICNEMGNTPTVLATGGDATALAREIPTITTVLPDLTLEGIGLVYQSRRSSRSSS